MLARTAGGGAGGSKMPIYRLLENSAFQPLPKMSSHIMQPCAMEARPRWSGRRGLGVNASIALIVHAQTRPRTSDDAA
jgi:hypothetical protein